MSSYPVTVNAVSMVYLCFIMIANRIQIETESVKDASIAIVGAGIAGSSCAASLLSVGIHVAVFDKSATPGGRMASRRVEWQSTDGSHESALLDHGVQQFRARRSRFRGVLDKARLAGCVAEWSPQVHEPLLSRQPGGAFVAVPDMPALSRHLLAEADLQMGRPVERLQRRDGQWHVWSAGGANAGPFDHVVLALPPAQAALLCAGLQDHWTDALAATPMQPCWTLLAITDDVDWPWDAASPDRGPLARVTRCDRKPGRAVASGHATWVAHATPQWSADHIELDREKVAAELTRALQAVLPCRARPAWHHCSAHRWRYACPSDVVAAASTGEDCWWDADLGLGVCGDFFGAGTVEDAWRSGDELADAIALSVERSEDDHDDARDIRDRSDQGLLDPALT